MIYELDAYYSHLSPLHFQNQSIGLCYGSRALYAAELNQQLHQQRHHHHDRNQNLHNHNSQQRVFQQDFDSTIAFINHERKQRSEETSLGKSKGQNLMNGNTNRHKHFMDSSSLSDSKTSSLSMDDFGAVDYAGTSRPSEVVDYPRNPLAASSTLVELTSRLDIFKERRSQLMEQLHNLDLSYGTSSPHKQQSPGWNILKRP